MTAVVERRSLVLRSGLDLCLLALLEDHVVYGYELTRLLAERGLPVAGGSSYPLLARLERQGLVTTQLRPSATGPARKYYALSPQGRDALVQGRREWLVTADAMTALLRPDLLERRSSTRAAAEPAAGSAGPLADVAVDEEG